MLSYYKKIYPSLIPVLLFFSYLWPNLLSIDKMGNQWLHLAVVNTLAFLTIIGFKRINLFAEEFRKSPIAKLWIGFLLIGVFSVFFADNIPEALITLNQYLTVVVSFYVLKILAGQLKNPINFFVNLIVFSLFLDLMFSFNPILKDLKNSGLIRPRSMDYKGLSANINIIAFMMVFKLPFVIERFYLSKKAITKTIYFILIGLVIYTVLAMGSRGAYIGLILVFIFTFLRSFLFSKLKQHLRSFLMLVIVFVLAISSNLATTPKSGVNSIQRAATININTQDGSVNQRLRYYKQGLNHILKNPLMGVGVGNWKLVSIDYDKENIDGFIVPFHAHNDFIQIAAEFGILGFLCYLFIFIILARSSIKRIFKKDKISLLVLFSLAVFTIDSLLNFPIARPISIITFLILISISELNIASTDEK